MRTTRGTDWVTFFVAGVPRPQGSKRVIPGRNGARPILVEASKGLKDWRGDVRRTASDAWEGRDLLEGPVLLTATFYFQRPKSHHLGNDPSRAVRPAAPRHKTGPPDGSKLQRAVEDALEGIVYSNDSRIVIWSGTKVYADPGSPPGVRLHVALAPLVVETRSPTD